MNPTVDDIRRRLRALGDPEAARFLQRFFKTGPGGYAEGDQFLGIRVPVIRKLARECRGMPPEALAELLRSPLHEERLLALVALVDAYKRADAAGREAIFRLYLDHARHIDNWDLVDSSAPHIVGAYLYETGGDTRLLDELARSASLWERRIAMLATFHFIRQGDMAPALRIAEQLLGDRHDLIHKAAGWMLREVGQRDAAAARAFLERHHRRMPRTMLRYAIEKLPERERQRLLGRGR